MCYVRCLRKQVSVDAIPFSLYLLSHIWGRGGGGGVAVVKNVHRNMIKNTKARLQAWRKTNCSETFRPRQKTTNLKTTAWNESKVHKKFRATNRKVGSMNHKPEYESVLLKSNADLHLWRLDRYSFIWACLTGPGLTCADLCWRIWVTVPLCSCKTSETLTDSAAVSGPRLLSHTHLLTERHRGDPSHHAAPSNAVLIVILWHHQPLCFPVSRLHANCDLDRGSISIAAAAWLPGAPGVPRDLIWRRLWEVRKLTLVLIYCRRTICPFYFLTSWVLFFCQTLIVSVTWMCGAKTSVWWLQFSVQQLELTTQTFLLKSEFGFYFSSIFPTWKLPGLMFPSWERARVPASAVCWRILLQIKESFHFASLISDWLEIKAALNGSSRCSHRLRGLVEFRDFCCLTRIFPFSLHHFDIKVSCVFFPCFL